MVDLFDSTSIKSLVIENRFLRSATGTGLANDKGEVTLNLIKHLMELVEGGVGLIIAGHASVHKIGRTSQNQLGIYDDIHIAGLKVMVNSVHDNGGKIIAQLNHGGGQSNSSTIGVTPKAPSAMPETEGKMGSFPATQAMTQKDIDQTVNAYRYAAVRAKKAGFDGVQLHCAHGYLLSQFLSPFFNKRIDQYGGNVSNRTRIVVDAYNKVREAVGEDYPVMIKMNVTDFLEEGLSREEAIEAAEIFDDVGFDAIELSGGTIWGLKILGDLNLTPCRNVKDEVYYLNTAREFKHRIDTPIILTGGIKSYDVAKQIVQDGDADYIGLCRPLIREPDLVNRWKLGDTRQSFCIHDNACLLKGGGKCYQIPSLKTFWR